MAEIAALKESLEKARVKVEKCKATIERHQKALEKKLQAVQQFDKTITLENIEDKKNEYRGMNVCFKLYEVTSKLDDIKGATRNLADAETILANWEHKLNVATEKERFLNDNAPQVIIDFLAKWKELAREWNIRGYKKYIKLTQELKEMKKQVEKEYLEQNPGGNTWSWKFDVFQREHEEMKDLRVRIAMLGGTVQVMATYHKEEERLAYLEKVLEAERISKMFDLINRVTAVTGTITDASELSINEKGNLDGIVVGAKGTAEVHTIGAGGWNIQCFHYRTLVHEIKGVLN